MNYTAYSREFVPFRSETTVRHEAERRPGILRRVLDAVFDSIYESRRRSAEREVAQYLERTGGRLTDEVELRMTQHLLGGDWHYRD